VTFREWWAAFIGADFYTKVEVAENAWMARDSWANIAEAQSAAEIERLRAALQAIYDETADYIRINNLGDVHHNTSMKMARDALAKSTGGCDDA